MTYFLLDKAVANFEIVLKLMDDREVVEHQNTDQWGFYTRSRPMSRLEA